MFWACFVQFWPNTRFCSTPAVIRGSGRPVEPWRPSCSPLNTGERAFEASTMAECRGIIDRTHDVELSCQSRRDSFVVNEMLTHWWKWDISCILREITSAVLCIYCPFLLKSVVTHTSQSCRHGCLRCWARPLPSSSAFTPSSRMKFRSWWVKMSRARVFTWRVWAFECCHLLIVTYQCCHGFKFTHLC